MQPFVPKVGEVIDRYGPSDGRYTSPVVEGEPYSYDKRVLPYVEDQSQYHQYEVIGDMSRLDDYIANCKDPTLKAQIERDISYYYNDDYSNIKACRGEIAGVEGFGSGGGVHYEFPIKIEYLGKLGILKEIK